jgi:hypothetical protein
MKYLPDKQILGSHPIEVFLLEKANKDKLILPKKFQKLKKEYNSGLLGKTKKLDWENLVFFISNLLSIGALKYEYLGKEKEDEE